MLRSGHNMKGSGSHQDRMAGPCWEATRVPQARGERQETQEQEAGLGDHLDKEGEGRGKTQEPIQVSGLSHRGVTEAFVQRGDGCPGRGGGGSLEGEGAGAWS